MEFTIYDPVKCCRTCLMPKEEMESIFEEQHNGKNLAELITALIPIEIQNGDEFSETICFSCKKKLTDAYDFRELAIQSSKNAVIFKSLNEKFESRSNENAAISQDSQEEEEYELIEFVESPVGHSVEIEEGAVEMNNTESCELETLEEEILDNFEEIQENVREYVIQQKPIVKPVKTRSLNCVQCGEVFSDNKKLIQHIKNNHTRIVEINSNSPSKVPVQNDKQSLLSALKLVHYKKESLKKHYCSICNKSFMYPSKLARHMEALHKNDDSNRRNTKKLTVFCQICSKGFPHNSKLVIHMRTHGVQNEMLESLDIDKEPEVKTPRILHTCEECNRNFYSTTAYNSHKILHSLFAQQCLIKEPREFRCSVCLQTNQDFESFNTHLKSHKDEAELQTELTCQICNTLVTDFNHLLRHTRKHPENATHKCQKCQRYFYWSNAFIDHIKMHNGTAEYKCEFCGKLCTSSSKLKSHMSIHTRSEEDPKYECLVCSSQGLTKKFHDKNYFKAHLQTHSEKSYKCDQDQCQKSFNCIKRLNEHKLIHTGKPFSCKVCNAKFTHRYLLNNHMVKHYGGATTKAKDEKNSSSQDKEEPLEMKFSCNYCGCSSFSTSQALKLHMKLHAEREFHKCKSCHQNFSSLALLQKHIDDEECGTEHSNEIIIDENDEIIVETSVE